MDYLKVLNDSYIETKLFCEPDLSKSVFVSDYIFNFVTYDSEISEHMTEKALEVALAINNRLTYEYIKSKDNRINYTSMVNNIFFSKKIEWGSSIRGAWWQSDITLHSCGIFIEGEQCTDMKFTNDKWYNFINSVSDFLRSI